MGAATASATHRLGISIVPSTKLRRRLPIVDFQTNGVTSALISGLNDLSARDRNLRQAIYKTSVKTSVKTLARTSAKLLNTDGEFIGGITTGAANNDLIVPSMG